MLQRFVVFFAVIGVVLCWSEGGSCHGIFPVIKDDFLVNDDTTGQWEGHKSPSIAMNRDGNFTVVWRDKRNVRTSIYGQRYDSSGNSIGPNFRVSNGGNPSIAMSPSGNSVIVWVCGSRIFMQMYDASGVPQDSAYELWYNSDVPSVAIDTTGRFVVTGEGWDFAHGCRVIWAQIFSNTGELLGDFRVDDDTISYKTKRRPDAAMSGDGRFVIVWIDMRNDPNYDTYGQLYGQLYDSLGSPVGNNFRISSPDSDNVNYGTVAMDVQGNFVVTWHETKPAQGVFARRFDVSGDTLNGRFTVSDIGDYPSIDMDLQGNFVIVWRYIRWNPPGATVYGQRYDAFGAPQGGTFIVVTNTINCDYSPTIAMDEHDDFAVAYKFGEAYDNIYVRRYFAGPQEAFRVNDDEGSAAQTWPAIAMNSFGNSIIAWQDGRRTQERYHGDVYVQRYDVNGDTVGLNFRTNPDILLCPRYTSVGIDGDGGFIIIWESRSGSHNIFGQRYNASGVPQTDVFKISEADASFTRPWFQTSMNSAGNFVVVWLDERTNPSGDVYAQIYNSLGDTIGANFQVNDDTGSGYHREPAVVMDEYGNFIVVWGDNRNGDLHVYGQRYNSSGVPQDSNFKVSEDTIGVCAFSWAGPNLSKVISVSADGNGNFVVAWQGKESADYFANIYAQRYSSSGSPSGNNFRVNNHSDSASCPSIWVEAYGKFIITWKRFQREEDVFIFDIYTQRYESNGVPIGDNYRVNQELDIPNPSQVNPVVAANSNQIVFAWQDARRSKNWDIYAKIVDWDWGGIEEKDTPVRSSSIIQLFQNRPNPFTGSTEIEYGLPKDADVNITIYNLSGQKVAILADENKNAGYYTVRWAGRDKSGKKVTPGIYFYHLQAGEFKATKKLTIIR